MYQQAPTVIQVLQSEEIVLRTKTLTYKLSSAVNSTMRFLKKISELQLTSCYSPVVSTKCAMDLYQRGFLLQKQYFTDNHQNPSTRP